MNAIAPSSLPSDALARRLADLCGEERNIQADFLLHLDEFERRKAYLAAGYGSLWTYCLEALHLRESSAGRRLAAMKVLRRFPALEAPLRDGRICLSTMNLLGPVLTDENLPDLVARAAFLSKADTEKLVVSIQPRVAPRDGVRRLPGAGQVAAGAQAAACAARSVPEVATALSPMAAAAGEVDAAQTTAVLPAVFAATALAPAAGEVDAAPTTAAPAGFAGTPLAPALLPEANSRAELRPISADLYSLRVTIDNACKAELDELTALLSHTTHGELGAVVREAIRCAIAKHGKRKGAVKPERERAPRAVEGAAPKPFDPRAIPLAVRREVWKRDGGRCAWTSPDGRRCNSTWKLELDHIKPAALGGKPTADNLQVACRPHNVFRAVEIFGREHMTPYLGEFTPAGGSHGT